MKFHQNMSLLKGKCLAISILILKVTQPASLFSRREIARVQGGVLLCSDIFMLGRGGKILAKLENEKSDNCRSNKDKLMINHRLLHQYLVMCKVLE